MDEITKAFSALAKLPAFIDNYNQIEVRLSRIEELNSRLSKFDDVLNFLTNANDISASTFSEDTSVLFSKKYRHGDTLTKSEVCSLLNCKVSELELIVKQGRLQSYSDKQMRFKAEDVKAFMERNKEKAEEVISRIKPRRLGLKKVS